MKRKKFEVGKTYTFNSASQLAWDVWGRPQGQQFGKTEQLGNSDRFGKEQGMNIGFVARTKQRIERILDDNEKVSANDILEALECALEAMNILEGECNRNYSEGKADGMERMAEIRCGEERSSE